MILYLDTSALLKQYILESGSEDVIKFASDPCYIDRELWAAAQKAGMDVWPDGMLRDASRFAAWVDPRSGRVLQIQDRMAYTDGSSRIKTTTRFLKLEKVETPPQEILDLLTHYDCCQLS